LVTGPVALALWLARTDLSWTAARVAFVVVTLVAAVCSFGALLVATNAITFWIVSSREIANAFTYGGLAGATYPSHLLVSWLRRLFLFALPIGAVAYLSGLWLLDAANPMGIPRWVQAAAPLHAVLAVGLAAVVWRAATRRYQSTGS
jgi:ABC-2 type transport system permease protein